MLYIKQADKLKIIKYNQSKNCNADASQGTVEDGVFLRGNYFFHVVLKKQYPAFRVCPLQFLNDQNKVPLFSLVALFAATP